MATTPDSPGTEKLVVYPKFQAVPDGMPKSPTSLCPKHRTVPSLMSAQPDE